MVALEEGEEVESEDKTRREKELDRQLFFISIHAVLIIGIKHPRNIADLNQPELKI